MAPPAAQPARPRVGLLDLLLLGAPDGKTELLEGCVPRVIITRSVSDARKVFKDVARDIYESQGAGWRKRLVEGKDTVEVERFHLSVDGTRVTLSVKVPRALWDAFGAGG